MRIKTIDSNSRSLVPIEDDREYADEETPTEDDASEPTCARRRQLYFYDNNWSSKRNSDECPGVQFHWVVASGNEVGRNGDENKSSKWNEFSQYDNECISLFKNNSNAHKIALYIQSRVGFLSYDKHAGKESFYEHVKTAAALPYVEGFVFDWDRTLQVTESMYRKLSLEKWRRRLGFDTIQETVEALSEFHAGGEERLQELREMFATIGNKPVFIVTANSAIKDKRAREVFKGILKNWGCENVQGMHYSDRWGKYYAMAGQKSLKQYCIYRY